MDSLELVDWPADRTLSLSGAPGDLRLPVNLRNTSDRAISIADVSLAGVRLGAKGAPLRLEPAPVGLVVAGGGSLGARIRLRLDHTTPPGRYAGEISLAGATRSVEIEVVEQIDLVIRPAPLIIDAALGRSQTLAVQFDNRGNTALTIDLNGRYPLGAERAMATERLQPKADGAEQLAQLIDRALGLSSPPALVEVGAVELAMADGPASLAPGDSLTTGITVTLPDEVSPSARLHVFAPVYEADLHLVIVTAAKPGPPAKGGRKAKGAEG